MRQRDLSWKGKKLVYKDRVVVELIPHAEHPKMYHLKFYWRDEKTPEFFNIIWAKENARIYAAQHLNQDEPQSSREGQGEV